MTTNTQDALRTALRNAIFAIPDEQLASRDIIIHAMESALSSIKDALKKPRFASTYCSQCGQDFGPGESGYSSCGEHEMVNRDSRPVCCSGNPASCPYNEGFGCWCNWKRKS